MWSAHGEARHVPRHLGAASWPCGPVGGAAGRRAGGDTGFVVRTGATTTSQLAVTGAGLGLGGAAWLVGDVPAALVAVAAAVALAGLLVTCLAALVPAALMRRLPTARLLAEE
ncbi:hypothetical protein GCE86_21850 [Micromonospora terminaliae]|uniref:FtsX-like permease family protein n=1 Tax=Micromonospora terminaliae TaxID=1914461 RepID=A0AAJ2ZJR1_9ACTN|nr:hypothetical protein [Micromonospora terminaliae]NES31080.1 hypothetical protein [Micromonospora terminaliae]QGL49434.1 hypothetical protein GCE86_21850 [Micromonospora terminaliae]